MNLIYRLPVRFLLVAGLALAVLVAVASIVFAPSGAYAIGGESVDSAWVYVCKTRTEWWDPFNWFGTATWRCATEWR